ncbi:MAG TPA: cysteine hydrolase [Dongiaceae bacterium]|jgi:nicotinamidase-related amidase
MKEYLAPERDRVALITIDVQRDFVSPNSAASVSGAQATVPVIRRLIDAFRSADAPIVHTLRLYRCNGSNVDLCHRAAIEAGQRIVMPGTSGAELIDEVKPSQGQRLEPELLLEGKLQEIGNKEWACYKPRLSAFFQTPLEDHLKSLGITTIVICGTDFPTSPRSTVYAASNRDFRIVLATDAISGAHDAGLDELAQVGVYLMGTEQLLNWLKRDRQAA